MKKLLLSLLVAGFATLAGAQTRSIDWSTDSIAGIDTIYSTDNGTAIPLEFVMKNNGTDTVFPNDTVWFQFALTNVAGTQLILFYPNAQNQNQFAIRMLNDTILPGDTAMISLSNLATQLRVTTSSRLKITLISHVLNRPGLGFETSTALQNNTKSKEIVWINPQGWGVGLSEELDGVKFNVYPNPATDVVNFETAYNKASKIQIMDLTGRLVETVDFTLGVSSVNVASYNKGIYFYTVISTEGKAVKAGKFTVN